MMSIAKSFGLAALAAGVVFAAASPASAVVTTFATYSAKGGANIRFVNSGNSTQRTTDATFYTTKTPTATTPGGVLVDFSFLQPQLAPYFTNITAIYTLNGSVAKNTAPIASSGFFIQSGVSGSFSFLTTTAITVGGPNFVPHTYAAGSNLLSGTFNSGNIVGTIGSSAGSSFASGNNGTTITFTSDFLDFTNVGELDRSQSLNAVTPSFSRHAAVSGRLINGALNSFRATASGQFSSDPAPLINGLITVPEPQSWSLMIIGFGLVGVAVRSRKAVAA